MNRHEAKPKISVFWVDVIRVTLLILLAVVAMNWGYFAKQVSSWLAYDLLGDGATQGESVIAGESDRLAIQSLGLNVPLVYVDTTDEITFQKGLEDGVVHYPRTAMPGEWGNAYYFGHSSDYVFKKGKYKTVFAILPRIEVGENVYITDHAGRQFVYKVIEKKVVEPKDISVLEQGDGDKKLLTLQTSWPLGTALKRYVVVCEMK